MKLLINLIPFLLFILVSCEDAGTSIGEFQTLSFNYSAHDSSGILTAKGTLNFTRNNSDITGSWHFDDGRSGNLAGKIENDTIEVDLYPGFADHNLILRGRLSDNTYTGEWIMYGWAILGRGTFNATVK